MNSYLYRLFAGLLNPSEEIHCESKEYKAALHSLIEIQKQLKDTLSPEQWAQIEELLAQKNIALAFDMFESFRTGIKLSVCLWAEIMRE